MRKPPFFSISFFCLALASAHGQVMEFSAKPVARPAAPHIQSVRPQREQWLALPTYDVLLNSVQRVPTLDSMRKLTALSPNISYWLAEPGRGGEFRLVGGSQADDGGGTFVRTLSGSLLARVRQAAEVTAAQYGAKADGTTDDTAALQAALAAAAAQKVPLVLGAGTYLTGPLTLSDGLVIQGAGSAVCTLKKKAVRGWALGGAVSGVTIGDLTIDCDASPIEGGIRLAGKSNTVRGVRVLGGDVASIVISTVMSNADAPVASADNLVEDCYVKGQKRYHEAAGLSPFLAGDGALRTVFRRCVAEDNGLTVAMDYFDSDNAPGTVFEGCVAIRNGTQQSGTGFWAEGEQTGQNHEVRFVNCSATNFTNAFGSSEQAKVRLLGGQAKGCRRAWWHINGSFAPVLDGLVATGCGGGIGSSTQDGVIATTGGMVLRGVTTTGTLCDQAFCNFQGGNGFTNDPIVMTDCRFDKVVKLSETNSGSRNVQVRGTVFELQAVVNNSADLLVSLVDCTFLGNADLVAIRTKAGSSLRFCRFYGTDDTKTAVAQVLDSFNLVVSDCYFQDYLTPIDANSPVGRSNVGTSNVNPVRNAP